MSAMHPGASKPQGTDRNKKEGGKVPSGSTKYKLEMCVQIFKTHGVE
jgi:hypothetical protein